MFLDIFFSLYHVSRIDPSLIKIGLHISHEQSQQAYIDASLGLFLSEWYNSSRPFVVYIHGFMQNDKHDSAVNIISALTKLDYNVFSVDWGYMAFESGGTAGLGLPFYNDAEQNSRIVGMCLAEIINAAAHYGKITFGQVSCVGFSLGAQVCAHFARNLNAKPSVIIGLDPPNLFFSIDTAYTERLTSDLADIVHIVHTDRGFTGTDLDDGHANFYINNGVRNQPGCDTFFGIDLVCSHIRVCSYFVEAILFPQNSVAVRCNSYDHFKMRQCQRKFHYFGFPVDSKAKGKLYFNTNSAPPYLKGIQGAYP
uniref:Lipase domain-containing protein n=1 Tax=Clastoptera arizonana TaxID=38151 RepID=A0A1B6CNR7_9HEMI